MVSVQRLLQSCFQWLVPRVLSVLCAATFFSFCSAWMSQAEASETASRPQLKLTFMISGGKQRQIYFELLARFREQYPDIDIIRREYEQETYKANIEGWLSESDDVPDVMFWFGGDHIQDFARQGLVRPIGKVWDENNFDEEFSPAIKAVVSFDGEPVGVPISYYPWGLYYRKSLFAELNVEPPTSWSEFLEAGERFKAKGIEPILLGAESGWPAAAWFDYLNLRFNGLAYHNDLLRGQIPFTDAGVLRALRELEALSERGFFNPSAASENWRSVLPYLYQKHGAMMLMGAFVLPQFPASIRRDIDVIRFPVADSTRPIVEEAPTDLLFIPARASNPEMAEAFLSFVASAPIQGWFNSELGMMAPNKRAVESDDRLTRQGNQILQGAEGFTQFFDRQTPRAFSIPAMEVLVSLMTGDLTADDASQTLQRLADRHLQ